MKIRLYDEAGALLYEQESEWEPFEDRISGRWIERYNEEGEDCGFWETVGHRSGERLILWPANGRTGRVHRAHFGDDSRRVDVYHSSSDTLALTRNETTKYVPGFSVADERRVTPILA